MLFRKTIILKKTFLLLLISFIVGCSASKKKLENNLTQVNEWKETTMPFKNLVYSGNRLFPIKNNIDYKSFRIWFNIGSSVERVITISFINDTLFGTGYNGYLVEYGELYEYETNNIKRVGNTTKTYYNKTKVIPKSGFELFFNRLELIKILEFKSADPDNLIIPLHKPFSLYVIEYKSGENYNQFFFYTNFPYELHEETMDYNIIHNLIFDEFGDYIKFPLSQ